MSENEKKKQSKMFTFIVPIIGILSYQLFFGQYILQLLDIRSGLSLESTIIAFLFGGTCGGIGFLIDQKIMK